MRTLLKALSFTGMLALAAPAYSQVSVDLHFGPPPPPRHEIIVERPYRDAVWTSGRYYYEPRFARYVWRPGAWGRPQEVRREEYRHDEARYDHARYDRDRDFHDRGERGHVGRRDEDRHPTERGRG